MEILGNYAKRYLLHSFGRGSKEGMGNSGCCAVVRGTTILKIAVLLIATTTTPTTITTTISVFVLCVVYFRRALFCARVGVWECIERAKEESRPVPVMSVSQRCGRVSLRRRLRTQRVTVSKYQLGWGSLVGSPKNYPIFQNRGIFRNAHTSSNYLRILSTANGENSD
jgi:hypothetical protein